jgi:ATP-dependent Clp protease ATP-binding subunit ClpC
VGHEFPQGDQFLYVTTREHRLEVQFIDPDAPAERGEESAAREGSAPAGALAAIALDPRGTADELDLLRERFQELLSAVEGAAWRDRKETALAMTGLADFWRSPDRFEILGQYEYQGRIEAGVRRTASLLQRLQRREGRQLPTQLVASVAQTMRLLELAREDVELGRPHAAFLEVESGLETGIPSVASDRFAADLGRMYRGWAALRHMRTETLDERPGDERLPYRLRLSINGYAACSILLWERGLHVFETPASGRRSFERSKARVRVVPQKGDPGDGGVDSLRKGAEVALADDVSSDGRIARRYRAEPSPLVRDGIRGWRTGRLDRVLAGDFDLIAEISQKSADGNRT